MNKRNLVEIINDELWNGRIIESESDRSSNDLIIIEIYFNIKIDVCEYLQLVACVNIIEE